MVGEAILHFTNPTVIEVENPGIALSGSAVVNDDIFPTPPLDLGAVDRLAHRRGEVAPTFCESSKHRLSSRLIAGIVLKTGLFNEDRGVESLARRKRPSRDLWLLLRLG